MLDRFVNAIRPRVSGMRALGDITAQSVPALQASMNQFTQALVTEVNSVHGSGYTLNGATGVNFFDPAGLTMSTIALSAAVTGSTDAIAAAAVNASGDNAVALQLAECGGAALVSLGGRSMRGFYIDVVGSVGVQVEGADRDSATRQAMTDQADVQRQSVSGVSIDDEMVSLIAQQQAYGAAARLITVASDMVQDLLRII